MHGHGAALAVGEDLDALDEAGGRGRGQRVGAVRVPDAEGDLDGLGVGSMKDVPLVSGMRQTLEVVGEKELSELGKHCTSCRAVTCFQLVVQALHQLIGLRR